MSTTTTTPTASTMVNLAKTLHGLLATSGLPDPVRVSLDYYDACIDIQPGVTAYNDPVAVVSALLLWSRLLHGITAEWRHTTETSRLHITIEGRLSSGVRARLYQGVRFDTVREWVLLEPGQHDPVSLDELAALIRDLHTAHPAA